MLLQLLSEDRGLYDIHSRSPPEHETSVLLTLSLILPFRYFYPVL